MSDAWSKVSEQFDKVGRQLRSHLDDAGARQEAKDAARGLADAVDQGFDAIGRAVRDESIREDVRELGRTLREALTSSIDKFGERVRGDRNPDDKEDRSG